MKVLDQTPLVCPHCKQEIADAEEPLAICPHCGAKLDSSHPDVVNYAKKLPFAAWVVLGLAPAVIVAALPGVLLLGDFGDILFMASLLLIPIGFLYVSLWSRKYIQSTENPDRGAGGLIFLMCIVNLALGFGGCIVVMGNITGF